MSEKQVIYHGDSEEELRTFPEKYRERFSYSLAQICNKCRPALKTKPLNGLGDGVKQLSKNGKPAYRCVYVETENYVHVLHVYLKTSDGTDSKHENTIKLRYKTAIKNK